MLFVEYIQRLISRYGIFDIDEVETDCSPSVSTRGNLTSYIEGFQTDSAIVVVYTRDNDIVDTYRLPYIDMPLDTLKQVLVVCLLYQEVQLEQEN